MIKKLFIGCCTHGDEQVGLSLAKKYPNGKNSYWNYQSVICNPKAVKLNQRFVEQDLNRSFPGKQGIYYEENRAFEITKLLEQVDFIIDIHQTTAQNNTCLIVNRISNLNFKCLQYFDIQNVIIDNYQDDDFEFGNKNAEHSGLCLDSVFPDKSMTVEYSQNDKPESEFAILEKDFNNFIEQKTIYSNKKYYTFVGLLAKKDFDLNIDLSNFVELTTEQKAIFGFEVKLEICPCFIGEKAYDNIYCYWLKGV